jgi:hypothetical protein
VLIQKKRTPAAHARWAFGLGLRESRALWRTPEGEWVVVVRGQSCPFALRNLTEWDDEAAEATVELVATADGRVLRRGEPVAPGDPAWVLPVAVRQDALA